jgi:hypothetical protein
MIRIGLAFILVTLLADPVAAAPCRVVSAQADMARRMQALRGCVQAPVVEAPAPADPLAGPRTAAVAGCQSDASAQSTACAPVAKAATPRQRAARRAPKRPAKRP